MAREYKPTSISLPPDLLEAAKAYCKKNRLAVSQYIQVLILRDLAERGINIRLLPTTDFDLLREFGLDPDQVEKDKSRRNQARHVAEKASEYRSTKGLKEPYKAPVEYSPDLIAELESLLAQLRQANERKKESPRGKRKSSA